MWSDTLNKKFEIAFLDVIAFWNHILHRKILKPQNLFTTYLITQFVYLNHIFTYTTYLLLPHISLRNIFAHYTYFVRYVLITHTYVIQHYSLHSSTNIKFSRLNHIFVILKRHVIPFCTSHSAFGRSAGTILNGHFKFVQFLITILCRCDSMSQPKWRKQTYCRPAKG